MSYKQFEQMFITKGLNMRKMRNIKTGITINVIKHIIIKNYWEYYITDHNQSEDIVEALVLGYEDELGDVSLSEIKPYVISETTDLNDIAPAPKWEWVGK